MIKPRELAEAIVTALNTDFTPSGGQSISAERKYLVDYSRAELQSLRISVVASGDDGELAARSKTQDELSIDVCFMQAVDPNDLEACDELADLVTDAKEFFRFRSMLGLSWVKTEHHTLHDPDHLKTFRTFTSAFTLIYRRVR